MQLSQDNEQFPSASSPGQSVSSLFLFGPPRLECDRRAVAISRHKAMALLAYLAVTQTRHSRDTLAVLLWPELDQSHARAALRLALATLTKALPGAWWEADRETIHLNLNLSPSDKAVWVDVAQFQALLSERRLHAHPTTEICDECLNLLTNAITLYQGDFLTGFSLRDSPDFDEWQFNQTEALRQQLVGALESLAAGHSARQELEPAIGYARRWLNLDPLHEAAHRQLMQLYAWAGRPHAALRQYSECARILERELGVPPQEATTQLYNALKEKQMLPPVEPQSSLSPTARPRQISVDSLSGPAVPPLPLERLVKGQLVGRERELARANALWLRVVAGESYALLVSGEPGIGKTRLAREIATAAQCSGGGVLTGHCYASSGTPYAPIAEFIRERLTDQRQGLPVDLSLPGYIITDLLSIAPDLRARYPNIPPNPRLEPQFEQQRLYDSVVALVQAFVQTARAPLLLFVEDIHWADSDTLFLLRHLIRRSRAAHLPLLTLMTFRDTEVELDEAGTLKEILLDLNRERLAEQIKLPRLDREQTGELLAVLLATGGEISAEFLDGVYGETEGNPFFVEEVCRALIEAGKLYYAGGRWRRSDMANIVIPQSVRQAILARVERLPLPAQDTLRLAAIVGHQFDFDTLKHASDTGTLPLSSIAGQAEEIVIAALERAVQAQLIYEMNHSGRLVFSFTHILIPFSVRQSLSGLRRQRLHRHVAEVIETHHPRHFEALAYHFGAAGEIAKAIEYGYRAAHQAKAMNAYESAIQHLRTAIDLLEVDEAVETRLVMLEELADSHHLLGEGVSAVPLYQEALKLWRNSSQPDKWLAVRLYRKIGETVNSINRYTDYQRLASVSRASLEAGLKFTIGEPPHLETARLLQTLSRDAWYTRIALNWEAAERYAQAATAMAQVLNAPLDLSAALDALAAVYGARGWLRERLEVCQRRLALSRDAHFDDQREQVNILYQTGVALYDIGEYLPALSRLLEAEKLAGQIHDVTTQADALTYQGMCFFRLDRWDDLLKIEDKLLHLQTHYAFERLGIGICFYKALNASVRMLRDDVERANVLRSEAYEFMIALGGPPEQWVRDQYF